MFTGGPGSGRSTQCDLLSIYTGYVNVSSGEALRKEIVSGSSRGLMLYKFMYNGDPMPNNIMTEIIHEEMLSKVMGRGFSIKVSCGYKVP